MTDARRWSRLMAGLGLGEERETFEALRAAWAEPHRRYHGPAHLAACLATFDEVRAHAARPGEVELALWFHDAVYRARGGKRDEVRSAAWARRFLRSAGAPEDVGRRVSGHVLATRHEAAVDDPDSRLVVDVDLAVLGADAALYDAYERGVREEYRWVPGPLYRRGRRAVLEGLLARPRIFQTEAFRERLEERARANLRRALAAL